LRQAHQRSQAAAIDELHLVELQHDVAVLDERVSYKSVQGKDFIPGHDPSVTLNDQNIADRAALQAQLHHTSSYVKLRPSTASSEVARVARTFLFDLLLDLENRTIVPHLAGSRYCETIFHRDG
jgi:hypothetical protein